MKIIPSLVEPTANDLFGRIQFLSPYYKQFQVDIEDGIFIKNKTLSIDEFVQYIRDHHTALSTSYVYDFHFMAVDYLRSIKLISEIKELIHIDVVFIHTALSPNMQEVSEIDPTFRMGLVINPEENIEVIANQFSLKTISILQLMTVNPGPQGSPFIPESLKKIEQLRKCVFLGKIYIDGAVNENSVPLMAALPQPPDILCPGSYLAKSPSEDIERRVQFLNSLSTE